MTGFGSCLSVPQPPYAIDNSIGSLECKWFDKLHL